MTMSTTMQSINQENIYNIIRAVDEPSEERKQRHYKTYIAGRNKFQDEKTKFAHKTFGVPQIKLPKAHEFLKKGTRLPHACALAERDRSKRKPPIPSARDCESRVKTEEKTDFCRENINFVTNLKPRQLQPKFVDTKYGKTQKLEGSGLVPRYVYRKNMGRVPEYIKKERQAARELQQEEAKKRQEWVQLMLDEEQRRKEQRQQRIEELKQLWFKKTEEFLVLPVVTDIPARVRRRRGLEMDLANLEDEIEKLSLQEFNLTGN